MPADPRSRTLGLRGRIVLWLVAIVAVALTALITLTYGLARADNADRANQDVIQELREFQPAFEAALAWMRDHGGVRFYGADLTGSLVTTLPGLDAVLVTHQHADHLDRMIGRARDGRHAGDQPAATDRHHQRIDRRHIGQHLCRDGALSRDRARIIERVDEGEAALRLQQAGRAGEDGAHQAASVMVTPSSIVRQIVSAIALPCNVGPVGV